jgi:hypothetical protein
MWAPRARVSCFVEEVTARTRISRVVCSKPRDVDEDEDARRVFQTLRFMAWPTGARHHASSLPNQRISKGFIQSE